MTKHGIPIDFPGQRKVTKVQTIQKPNDYQRFKKFATMIGVEEGCFVTAIVPMGHADFRRMKRQGYKVAEVWEKGESM